MKTTKTSKRAAVRRQRGMASIVITMVTMVVISLIVLGFATISRREQRQALDQLLSTQAFYAAESAVEDAKSVIEQRVATGQPVIAKDNCTTNNSGGTYPVPGGANDPTVVDANFSVSYSCLLVDPAPGEVQFDGVGNDSIVVPIATANPITSMDISWRPTSPPATGTPATDCPNSITGSFSPQTGANAWSCGYGVLRADIVPTDGVLTTNGLTASSVNGFFVPLRNNPPNAGDLAYNTSANRPNVVSADCTTGTYAQCTAHITNISGGVRSMSLRLSVQYRPSNITVQAFNGSNPQPIRGVQARIDATGKATDVLRRIEVRLPIVNTRTSFPNSAISSNGSVCKRFSTTNTYFSVPGDIVDRDTENEMCSPQTSGTP